MVCSVESHLIASLSKPTLADHSDFGIVRNDGPLEDKEEAIMNDITLRGSVSLVHAFNVGNEAVAAHSCIVVHDCILDGGT